MGVLRELLLSNYKDAFMTQQVEIRELREALRSAEYKLAVADQSAIKALMPYGFEAVQRYKDLATQSDSKDKQ